MGAVSSVISLSVGAIVGVVLAALLIIAGLSYLIYWLVTKPSPSSTPKPEESDSPGPS